MRACPAMRTARGIKNNYVLYIHPPRKLSAALMKIVCTFARLLRQTRAVPQMHMVAVGNMTTSSCTCFLHSTAQRALCASASEQGFCQGYSHFAARCAFGQGSLQNILRSNVPPATSPLSVGHQLQFSCHLMSSCRLVCCCAGAPEPVCRGCAKRAPCTGSCVGWMGRS